MATDTLASLGPTYSLPCLVCGNHHMAWGPTGGTAFEMSPGGSGIVRDHVEVTPGIQIGQRVQLACSVCRTVTLWARAELLGRDPNPEGG